MFTNIDDFAKEWTQEAQMTRQVMNLLTDESLQQAITNQHRTLGQLAWHLVVSVHYMTSLGLDFEGPADGKVVPDSAAVIAEQYQQISEAILNAVKTQWSNEILSETQTISGEEWNNGATLRFTLMHQAHHRGQMTVLMRQAGLRIPELYGPNYDSWIDKGMEPLV